MKHGLNTSLANWQATLCANIVAYGELENEPFKLDFVPSEIDEHAHSDSRCFELVEKHSYPCFIRGRKWLAPQAPTVAQSFSLPIRSTASIKRGVSTVKVARM